MGNNNTIPISSSCRIIVVGQNGDDALTELKLLPPQAKIVSTGLTLEEIEKEGNDFRSANVLFNGNADTLAPIIRELHNLRWIHSITAGIDHLLCPEITQLHNKVIVTNAKGVYSSSLAEYVIGACLYFNKNIPRLISRFCVGELKNKTIAIIGYGDIGAAVARLSNAFGMKVIALRKRPELSKDDPFIDRIYGIDGLDTIMAEADFVVVALALTKDTYHFIQEKHLKLAKQGQIFINIARGAVVDENALINALRNGDVAGAALDVFTVEPLPTTSPIWDLENVLLSPHNADMTSTFRHESVRSFCENASRFVNGESLLNVVNITAGY